jgi:hypothetical protein
MLNGTTINGRCPYCGSSDHSLLEAGEQCLAHAHRVGWFVCKKDCWMEGFEDAPPVFQASQRPYLALRYHAEDGFAVLDDMFQEHFIGRPGEAFFDEYFKVWHWPADGLCGERK